MQMAPLWLVILFPCVFIISMSSGYSKVVKGFRVAQGDWGEEVIQNADCQKLCSQIPLFQCITQCCISVEKYMFSLSSVDFCQGQVSFYQSLSFLSRPSLGCCVSAFRGVFCFRVISGLHCRDLILRQKSSSFLHFFKLVAKMPFCY